MHQARYDKIAGEMNLSVQQVANTASLIAEGATVPFIARYRKEATGALDEVAVTTIRNRLSELEELEDRRMAVIKSLAERNLLTDELSAKINAAETLSILEDLYLPFRPKRRTRATVAREKGLEPLARKIFEQSEMDVQSEAALYLSQENGVLSIEEALAGARDIIAEWINEDPQARHCMRELFWSRGMIHSRVLPDKIQEGMKYQDYYDWREPVAHAPSHRVLAMRRGEREEVLSLSIFPPEDEALQMLRDMFVKGEGEAQIQVARAVVDGYKRLLSLSLETETRLAAKKKADATAIAIFAENLRQLLLSPPLGQKAVLAIDPGFRTGCKTVCLDRQGKLLHHETIFPFLSEAASQAAAQTVRSLCEKYHIEAVAIGNGTAGRETESFIRRLNLAKDIVIVMVNESGASVYSASDIAREEFPDCDITVRGAVSIGRRLMDPLAELVKIDPKAIGVGQYQHDVDPTELQRALDDVVISCVNAVGVELNTASAQLLSYVSGLGPSLAASIVKHRDENGPFSSREDLKKVKRLGPKAFEQAAGFLRIRGSAQPLDASAVHPESYSIVEKMAQDQQCSVAELMKDEGKRRRIVLSNYVTEKVGLPTLNDILSELAKPGRDPRLQFASVVFAEGINQITDLVPGMKLSGVVTNITAFGAFVDIGVHQDGLVHLSEMADRFVKAPADVVKVGQKVDVTVMRVDLERKRISLSMKKTPGEKKTLEAEKASAGQKEDNLRKFEKKKSKESSKPFNNPFAEALKKK